MTLNAMDSRSETPSVCPNAEGLSCFIDGELAAEAHRDVETHVRRCSDCRLAIDEIRALEELRADRQCIDCCDEELLLGYLSDTLPPAERAAVAQHADGCDACIQRMSKMHRSLELLTQANSHAGVGERKDAGLPAVPRQRAPRRSRGAARLSRALYSPMLLPAAFAAGVALFIAFNPQRFSQPTPSTRGVSANHTSRRMTMSDASLRAEPHIGAPIVAQVSKGTLLDLQQTRDGWSQVQLPDGTAGWVPAQAFE